MSAEHGPNTHESSENQGELEALAAEKRAEREASTENTAEQAEHHAEKQSENAETARKIIDKHDAQPEEPKSAGETAPPPTFAAKLNQALSYQETMASVQQKLKPASRAFSQVIHAPAVEKVSEALENTVMRPSVALGAVITAVAVGGLFYFFDYHYGYGMRGSELIASLLVGGLIGLAVETIVRSLKRARR